MSDLPSAVASRRPAAAFAAVHWNGLPAFVISISATHLNIAVQRDENGGVEDGTYNIQTGNHLIGGQLGGTVRRTINRFGWEVTGKAGIYENDAEQTQSVIDFPNFPLRPTTSARAAIRRSWARSTSRASFA